MTRQLLEDVMVKGRIILWKLETIWRRSEQADEHPGARNIALDMQESANGT